MDPTGVDQQLSDVAGLADPVRRALYRHVAGRDVAVTRDEAARAVGISRPLAAYHLDRLVDDGLLDARYERRTGRQGPGAGRPAKLYTRSARQIELSLPARDYALLAELLAGAVEADPCGAAQAVLNSAARALGEELGVEVARRIISGDDRVQVIAAVRDVLADRGYEPFLEDDGALRLRNCPFDRIAAAHRQLVCGANLALLEGLVDRIGGAEHLTPVLHPQPGRCCVEFRAA